MTVKKLLPAFWIVLASLLFATDSTVRHQGLNDLDVTAVGFLEHLIAFWVVVPFVFFQRGKKLLPQTSKDWLLFLFLGIGGSALAGSIYARSLQFVGPSTSSLWTMLQPIFVLFFAFYFLRERYSSFFVPCALWVVANSILMSMSGQDWEAVFDDSAFLQGSLLALTATAIWGGSTVVGKALSARYPPSTLVFWRFAFAASFLGGVLLVKAPVQDWSPYFVSDQVRSVLYLGVFVQTAAYFFYYLGLRKMQASMATFIELLYPLAGVFIATLVGGQGFGLLQAFGAVNLLIALGLLLAVEYPKSVRTDP